MQWLIDAIYDRIVALIAPLDSLFGVIPDNEDMIIGDGGVWVTQHYIDWTDAVENFNTAGSGFFGGGLFLGNDLDMSLNNINLVANISFLTATLQATPQTSYVLTNNNDHIAWQCQRSDWSCQWGFYSKDGDGTDSMQLQLWFHGQPAAGGVREFWRTRFQKDPTNICYLETHGVSGGTIHPQVLQAGTTGGHLKLQPDGDTEVGGGPLDFTFGMGGSGKDPTSDAPDDWVEVKIGGSTFFLPAYTA